MKFRLPTRPKAPPVHVPTLTEVVAEGLPEKMPEPLAAAGVQQAAQAGALAQNASLVPTALPQEAQVPGPVPAEKVTGADGQAQDHFAGQAKGKAQAQAQAHLEKSLLVPTAAVQPLENPVQGPAPGRLLSEAPGSGRPWPPDVLEEAVVHRVMQRVDIGLEQRLRDAIATVVQEQTRSLLPRLREEVESVVRQVVYEAVADEVAADPARKAGRG